MGWHCSRKRRSRRKVQPVISLGTARLPHPPLGESEPFFPIYKYSEILYAQKTCRSCRSQVRPCFSQLLSWLIGCLVGWLVGWLVGQALRLCFDQVLSWSGHHVFDNISTYP